MEAYTATAPARVRPGLRHLLRRQTPLLRLQSDDSLVALTRGGNRDAFEALVHRYRVRLLAFCAHMLGKTSQRDAEDVVQEVLVAAYTAMVADERPIEVRPWLYRIARNHSLNYMRGGKVQTTRVASGEADLTALERRFADDGLSVADQAGRREDLRRLVGDIQSLPESQRAAIVLRELEAMSYKDVAQTLDTSVPSVKSLLVRARLSLADIAHGRELSCDAVRFALAQQEEGIRKLEGPERAHVKDCTLCADTRKRLKTTSSGLAALSPVGILGVLGRLLPSKAGASAGGAGAASSVAGGGVTAGAGAMATKAAVVLVAATVLTGSAPHFGSRSAAPVPQPVTNAAPAISTAAAASGSQAAPSTASAAQRPAPRMINGGGDASSAPVDSTPPSNAPAVTVAAPSADSPSPAASIVPDPSTAVTESVGTLRGRTDPGGATAPVIRGRTPPLTSSGPPPATDPPPASDPPASSDPPPVSDPPPSSDPPPPSSDPPPASDSPPPASDAPAE